MTYDTNQAEAVIREAEQAMAQAQLVIKDLRLKLALEVDVNMKLVHALNQLVNDVSAMKVADSHQTRQNVDKAVHLANDILGESRNINLQFINE